jgi:hypothetical protein
MLGRASARTVSMGSALSVLCLASLARAAEGDPCDFVSSGATSFSFEQVKRCYESVPFEPADLTNILGVIEQHRSFSDLAEAYDARVHWRAALAALAHDHANDAAMHDALKREHHEFRNVHVSYFPPSCYSATVIGFTPFEFGSTVRDGAEGDEQIIFVESTLLGAQYLQGTGVDASALIGQRVVSINGVPVLDYFRAYADDLKIHVDAGGALNGVLASDNYSLRLNGGGDYLPDRLADEYVLETIDGQRSSVTLPWLYIPRVSVQPASALPLTQSTEEFVRLCRPEVALSSTGAVIQPSAFAQPFSVEEEREDLVRRLRASAPQPTQLAAPLPSSGLRAAPSAGSDPAAPTAYYEVPPDRLGQDIEVIVPLTTNAVVLQYDGHVTALQLRDTNAWIDVARQGIEYACQNSDRLIVDLRGNTGGNDTTIRWLHHYLFPEAGQLVPAGLLPVRLRNDNPVFDELLFNSARFMAEYAPGLGLDRCALFFTPGCMTDVDTGEPLIAAPDWFATPSVVERRGAEPVSLSRLVAVLNVGDPEFDSASCAGRFQGDDLVLLTDGRNASGGYFLPASFAGEGVIVNAGGFLGEPMAMGRARSGASFPVTQFASIPADVEAATEGAIAFEHELLAFQRPVNARMEMLGVYRKDGVTLHIDDPVEADLHVNVWTDLPGSDGFVYERVLDAVDQTAATRAAAAGAPRARPPE